MHVCLPPFIVLSLVHIAHKREEKTLITPNVNKHTQNQTNKLYISRSCVGVALCKLYSEWYLDCVNIYA
jgi:hypothetical protein